MMFARASEVSRIGELLLAGKSVNLIGGRWSGRSEVLKRVRQHLLAQDLQVIVVRGIGPEVALEAIRIALSASARKNLGPRGAMVGAVVDELEREIHAGQTVVLIDDADQLDRASWVVLESIHKSTGVAMLATDLRRSPGESSRQSLMAIAHPVVQIALEELGLGPIHELLESRLDGSLDPALAGRIHTMSGGTPGIAIAVIESAVAAGLVYRAEGVWRGDADLWNPDLIGVFETLLASYPQPLQSGVEMLSIVGVTDWRTAERLVGQEMLETLEGHGLVGVVVANASAMIAINPAGIVEYFRNQPLSARRMRLVEAVSESLGSIPAEDRAEHIQHEWRRLESATGQIPMRRSVELPVLARMFTEDYRMKSGTAERRWQESPSTRTAADLLLVGLTGKMDPNLLASVVAHGLDTPPVDPVAEVELRWLTARALLRQGQPLELARQLVLAGIRDGFTANHALEAIASVLDLEMVTASTTDVARLRALAAGDDFGARVATVALAGALIVRGDGAGALAALEAREPHEHTPLVNTHLSVLRGLALFADGQHLAATQWASSQLERAVADLDRLSLAGHAYVATLGLASLSRYDEAADVASVPLLVEATAAPLLLAPDRALLVLMWMLDVLMGRPSTAEGFAAAAEGVHPRSRALPLSDEIWGRAISYLIDGQRSRARDEFAALATELRDEDYAFAGSIAEFLSRVSDAESPGPSGASDFGPVGGKLFHAYLSARHGAVNDDADAVEDAAEQLAQLHAEPAAANYFGHAARLYRAAGRADDAARVRLRLVDISGGRVVGRGLGLGETPLTSREAEIVRLIASGLSNGQIAQRLVISIRTVESHINNVRRKTGLTERSDLGGLSTFA